MTKFIKKHWLFLLILILGIFLRTYKLQELFLYGHDHDLSGWVIRDIIENKHFRLIGQETSSRGVFIGPAFYYALIPFYLLAGMDPAGGLMLPVLIAIATIASVFIVLSKLFNKNVGLIGSFVYSVSFYTAFTDREVVPTTPAMLWSVWFLYMLHCLLKRKYKQGFLILGILVGFIWHISLALALLLPLVFLAIILAKKLPNIRQILPSLVIAIILLLPLLLFEVRHEFQQTNAVINALTTKQNQVEGAGVGFAKLDRTMQLVYKNVTNIFYRTNFGLPAWFMAFILTGTLLFFIATKRIDEKHGFLMVVWMILFMVFFTLNPINLSEYYINGMNIIWITIFAVALTHMLPFAKYRPHIIILLAGFAFININTLISLPINKSGYLERKAIVQFIKDDAKAHNYPCVSVSYITTPGNNLGYRYFFFLEKMHVNLPKSGSPVYSIVFPHSKVDKIDKSFGALGLVLPDYRGYNEESVKQSCSGQNSNLTDPLFGFTK